VIIVTYELDAVNMPIPLDKIIDVPVFHPLRNQSEPVFSHSHSQEWQNMGMPQVFPSNALSTKPLQSARSDTRDGAGGRLTLRMTSRSLVRYTRTTLMATRRPWYVLLDTSAKPPHSTSSEPSEQSGMCIGFGITRCRLHVLQSLLNNFTRSGSGRVRSPRRCSSC